MRVDVSLPGERFDASKSVCVVVDVLRASTSIVTMLERGCERVVAAANVAEARKLRERLPDHLLCGEIGGLPPEGFDYGNSPVEFSRLDLTGRRVIHATGNGTKALAQVAGSARAVLVGCSRNRAAVARAAVAIAEEIGADVTIVCAGDEGASDEDLVAGAAIVAAAAEHRPDIVLGDSARSLLAKYDGDFERAVLDTGHARTLRGLGLGDDVDYSAQLDVSDVVPLLERGEGGMLVLRAAELPTT